MDNLGMLGLYDLFELPNGKKVKFKRPTVGDIEKANIKSAEYTGKLLKENSLLLKQEIQVMVGDNAEVIAQNQDKVIKIINDLQALEEEYSQVEDVTKRLTIADEMQKVQMKLFDYFGNMHDIYGYSLEAQVEKHRRLIMMHLTTINEDGSLYWPTVEALGEDEDIDSYNAIAIRYAEIGENLKLTDEQRYAVNELLKQGVDNLGLGELLGENGTSNS